MLICIMHAYIPSRNINTFLDEQIFQVDWNTLLWKTMFELYTYKSFILV